MYLIYKLIVSNLGAIGVIVVMSTNSGLDTIGEVYWLLDRVLEDLGMVKQLLYDKYERSERLLLSALLAFSGLMNDDTEINTLIRELSDFKWKSWSYTLSYYLGILAKNYIKKRHGLLPDNNEIKGIFEDLNKRLKEFHKTGDSRKIIDALFLEALILDLTINVLDLGASKLNDNDVEFTNRMIEESISAALNLPYDYRIKVAYTTLLFHIFYNVFDRNVVHNTLEKLLNKLLDSLTNTSIEYRAFLLRIFTALKMVNERQVVLKSLVNEYKSRFMYTTEKTLLKNLIAKLVSGEQNEDLNIEYREEGEETITLKIILTEEQIESIARPNIVQLCLLALGLVVSGYHSSYALPLHEQGNYVHFLSLIKEVGEDKVHDRLLLLDKFNFDRAFTAFLNERFWPIFRNKLILELILLTWVAIVLDHFSSPILGNLVHFATLLIGSTTAVLCILNRFASIIHAEWSKVLRYLISKERRQILINSLKEEFYRKLSIAR